MIDRDMIDRWMIVRLGREEVMRLTDDEERGAEYALGYVYVDSSCGITLNVEAWCNFENEQLQVISRPIDVRQRNMMRYGYFVVKEKRLLDAHEVADLQLSTSPDWLKYYAPSEEVISLRTLTLIDPLRAPGFPDDIKFLILDKEKAKEPELVWGRLVRQLKQDLFVCNLLNEPTQNYGIHKGDLLCVYVFENPNGLGSACLGKASTHGLS